MEQHEGVAEAIRRLLREGTMSFSMCPDPGDPIGKGRSTFPSPCGSRLSLHHFKPQVTPLSAQGGATHPWLHGAMPWSYQSWWPWGPEFIRILTKSREKSYPWNFLCFAHRPGAVICLPALPSASRSIHRQGQTKPEYLHIHPSWNYPVLKRWEGPDQ